MLFFPTPGFDPKNFDEPLLLDSLTESPVTLLLLDGESSIPFFGGVWFDDALDDCEELRGRAMLDKYPMLPDVESRVCALNECGEPCSCTVSDE
jgi:hypothetical protein